MLSTGSCAYLVRESLLAVLLIKKHLKFVGPKFLYKAFHIVARKKNVGSGAKFSATQ